MWEVCTPVLLTVCKRRHVAGWVINMHTRATSSQGSPHLTSGNKSHGGVDENARSMTSDTVYTTSHTRRHFRHRSERARIPNICTLSNDYLRNVPLCISAPTTTRTHSLGNAIHYPERTCELGV